MFDGYEDSSEQYSLLDNVMNELDDMSELVITPKTLKTINVLEDEDFQIFLYPYTRNRNDFLFHYIYPFWRKEFLSTPKNRVEETSIAFLTDWSKVDIMIHNMGLRSNTLCFQLEVSSVPIGFLTVLLVDKFDRESESEFNKPIFQDRMYLYNFVVEAPFRGEGYGRKMLKYVLDYLSDNYKEYRGILLGADNTNERLIHFYNSMGFQKIRERNTEEDYLELVFK